MSGPYDLTQEKIEEKIEANKMGNYALGELKEEKGSLVFIVKYIGRSDDCLRTRLKAHTNNYDKFKFSYAKTVKEAFEKECNNYHDFGEAKKLDNKVHPDRSKDENWKCPQCKNFG